MVVAKRDLVAAIGHARTKATLRRNGNRYEADVVLCGCHDQLSVRSSHAAMDIRAEGVWASPVATSGPTMRRLASKLKGPTVALTYIARRLFLDSTSIPAREI